MKKIFSKIMGTAVLTIGVGTSIVFLTKSFLTNQETSQLGQEYSVTVQNKNVALKLSYYNFTPQGNGLFGATESVNKAGYKTLGAAILQHLYYSSEIGQLKEIVFGNRNVISADANGLYFPSTKQIFINIAQFKKYTNHLLVQNNIPTDVLIKNLLGVIAHEYGHHFMNVYANSLWADSKHTKIYQTLADGSRVPQAWSEKFLNSFVQSLHYNTNGFSRVDDVANRFGKNGPIASIANHYDPKSLFVHANSVANFWKSATINYNFFTGNSYFKTSAPASTKNLDYIFSLSELATRKMQQIMYRYPYAMTDFDNWGRMVPKHLSASNEFSVATFVSDLMKNYVILHNNVTYQLAKIQNHNLIYMEDNAWGGEIDTTKKNHAMRTYGVLNPTVQVLYDSLQDVMHFNDPVSQIYARNRFEINAKGNLSLHFKSRDEEKAANKVGYYGWANNYLQLQGYLPLNTVYNGLVFKNDQSQFSKPYPITTSSAQFNKKASLFGTLETTKMPTFYTTKQEVDLTLLQPHSQIYWWNDLNHDHQFQKTEAVAMAPLKHQRIITNYQNLYNNGTLVADKKLTFAAVTSDQTKTFLIKDGYKPWN